MLVDLNTLRGLASELGPEALGTLIALFQEDAGQTVKKLEDITTTLNDEALALEVHTLKSVAATYGAMDVLALAKELDSACKQKVPAGELVPKVRLLIETLKNTITEIASLDVEGLV